MDWAEIVQLAGAFVAGVVCPYLVRRLRRKKS